MAKALLYSGLLTPEQMNSGQNYRVKFSYGAFSISVSEINYELYYYAYKRLKGKLYKTYVGKCGEITRDKLHQATMKLSNKLSAAKVT